MTLITICRAHTAPTPSLFTAAGKKTCERYRAASIRLRSNIRSDGQSSKFRAFETEGGTKSNALDSPMNSNLVVLISFAARDYDTGSPRFVPESDRDHFLSSVMDSILSHEHIQHEKSR